MGVLENVSIIMPVFNEKNTIEKILEKILSLEPKEIIIVDDGSTDGTREILKKRWTMDDGRGTPRLRSEQAHEEGRVKIVFHEKNQGKGTAIRTALQHVTGDIVTIQDADLEYNPEELQKLVKPIIEGKYSVVYGSRFLELKEKSYMLHYVGNKFLNFMTNLIFNSDITDMETCYKVFKKDVILSLNLKARKFDFEPEVTARILRKKIPICELPISYRSRAYKEGKKIGWRDGVVAVWTLLKYRIVD